MKTLLAFIFSLFTLSLFAQELELDFAHRYGIIENDLRHSVRFVEYFDEFETWVVAGYFESEIDVGINSTAILTSENSERLGYVAMYDSDFEILNYFKTGDVVESAALTETDIIISGSFTGIADFDFEDDDNELYESQSSSGNGYLASYSRSSHNLNWINILNSESILNSVEYCTISNGSITAIVNYLGSQFGGPLIYQNGTENIEIFSDNGPSSILFQFDINGNYISHFNFFSNEGIVQARDFVHVDNKLFLSFGIWTGNFNAGINLVQNFNFNHTINALICVYDLNTLDLLEFYKFDSTNDQSGVTNNCISYNGNNNELIICNNYGGEIEFESHDGLNPIFLENSDLDSSVILKINSQTENSTFAYLHADESLSIKNCINLDNGDTFLGVQFIGNLYFGDEFLAESQFSTFFDFGLAYLNSHFNGLEFFEFEGGQGSIAYHSFSCPSQDALVIGGSYEGQFDFDFSGNSSSLGNSGDDNVGYIAKYNFDSELSIMENSLKVELDIFPNPTTGIINIHNQTSDQYCMINVQGEISKKGLITEGSIDLSDQKSGIYMLKCGNETIRVLIN